MNATIILGIVIALCIIVGIVSIYFWGADNPVEEVCEDIIKKETGVDIDLSPGTPPSSKVNPH